VKDYQLLDYTPINYSGKLVPLKPMQPLTVPDGDAKWGIKMPTKGSVNMQIDVPQGLKSLPFRIDLYYDKTITLLDSGGKAIWHTDVKGLKNYQVDELNIPLPSAGHYTIQIGCSAGLEFQTFKGLDMVFPGFIAEMGAPSPRVYFYVPSGLRTIAMYIPAGDFGGSAPQVVMDPNGKQVLIKSYDGGTLVIANVPEGQDGKAWSLVGVRTPNAPMRLLNAPNFFSLSPETLLVPQDALNLVK
ncbi:MAG: hypothetical protein ABI210_00850, partial [Abditibacteriaceae bacterium]